MTTLADIYPPGESIQIHTDLMPSTVTPLPPGVPSGRMLRTLVTERALTVMWQSPAGQIGRVDIPMTTEQTQNATFNGGTVGNYAVARAGGCGCRAKAVRAVNPFPSNQLAQAPRLNKAAQYQTYGVPPARWSRKRG